MRKQNKKERLNTLTKLCLRYFGTDYEWWSWEHTSGTFTTNRQPTYKTAIELPKYKKDGSLCYSDPFISIAGGSKKALDESAEKAIYWILEKFEKC